MKSMICLCVLLAVASAAPPTIGGDETSLDECLYSLVNKTDPAVRVAMLLLNELAPTGEQCENSKFAVFDIEDDDDDDECDENDEYCECDDDDEDPDNDCETEGSTTEDDEDHEGTGTTDEETETTEDGSETSDDYEDDEHVAEPRRCLTCESLPELKTSFLNRISEFAQLASKTEQINNVFAEMEKCLCKNYDE